MVYLYSKSHIRELRAKIATIKMGRKKVREFLETAKKEGKKVRYIYSDGHKSYPESFDPNDIEVGDGFIIIGDEEVGFEDLIEWNGISLE